MDTRARKLLSELAQGQRGLFSAAQAAQFGVSRSQLWTALQSGSLRRSRYGVYAVSGTPFSRWESVIAAALAIGPGAVISHTSAGAIHGLYAAPPRVPEVTVRGQSGLRLAGVACHRIRELAEADSVIKYGVAITTPARTLLDMAGRVAPAFLARMMDEGLVNRLWTTTDVAACLERAAPNAPGRGRVKRLLAERAESPNAESVLESRVYRSLRPLAPFAAHYMLSIGGSSFVLDVAWPERRVAAEIIGREHRVASRTAFDRERHKLNVLAAAGWQVAHLTSTMSDKDLRAAVRALF